MTRITDFNRGTWGNPPDYYSEWSNSDLENLVHACEMCGYEPVTEIDREANMFICDECKKKIDDEI